MSDVVIEKVETKRDLKKFIRFPWKVYENDPNWVPPLFMEMREKLDKEKNPFFNHAEMDLYLAYKNNQIAGRIAAILDKDHNTYHNEKTGFFGLYESFNDLETAQKLVETAAQWNKKMGMNALRGPMNLSMNDECGFLLEGFDSLPVVMMPYNPPYYLDLMEKCGLSKIKDLYAFYMTRDHKTEEKVKTIVEKIRKKSPVSLRTIDLKNIREEARKIQYVYNQAWKDNWGFVPWRDEDMDHMAENLKKLADPDLVIFAEVKGKTVGFAFGLPNYNEVLQKLNGRLFPFGFLKFLWYRRKIKGMRAVVFGVVDEYQNTGVSYLLYSELEKNGKANGYQWGETSWQLEDNEAINRFTESLGGRIYKKYRIYEKPIP